MGYSGCSIDSVFIQHIFQHQLHTRQCAGCPRHPKVSTRKIVNKYLTKGGDVEMG